MAPGGLKSKQNPGLIMEPRSISLFVVATDKPRNENKQVWNSATKLLFLYSVVYERLDCNVESPAIAILHFLFFDLPASHFRTISGPFIMRGVIPSLIGRALRTGYANAAPGYRAFASISDVKYPHQPLGAIPSGTNLGDVRTKWGSNAMDLINETDVIEVDGDVAICDGGGGAQGHPLEYIKLFVSDEGAGPQVCKYCGLRYIRKRT